MIRFVEFFINIFISSFDFLNILCNHLIFFLQRHFSKWPCLWNIERKQKERERETEIEKGILEEFSLLKKNMVYWFLFCVPKSIHFNNFMKFFFLIWTMNNKQTWWINLFINLDSSKPNFVCHTKQKRSERIKGIFFFEPKSDWHQHTSRDKRNKQSYYYLR